MSLQVPVLFKQVFKFILYNNIVWLMELARQCVHSHTEQLANRFQEGRAKNLLPLRINLVAGTHSSKAWFRNCRINHFTQLYGFNRSKAVDTSGVLTFFFTLQAPHARVVRVAGDCRGAII